jgi:hypothetical protein
VLIKNGANVNAMNKVGNTALYFVFNNQEGIRRTINRFGVNNDLKRRYDRNEKKVKILKDAGAR